MAFVSFDERWLDMAPLLSNATGIPEADVGWGMARLAHVLICHERERYGDLWLASAFGPANAPKIKPALVAFNIIATEGGDWWPVVRPRRGGDGPVREKEPAVPVVYFIQSGDDGPIKIGFTTRLDSRVRALQTSHGTRLRVLATTPGTPADEASLHRRFAGLRKHGEWFEPGRDLVDHIEELQLGRIDTGLEDES
jgi:hypothetical protein